MLLLDELLEALLERLLLGNHARDFFAHVLGKLLSLGLWVDRNDTNQGELVNSALEDAVDVCSLDCVELVGL